MRISEVKLPMRREVSALNTCWLVRYLQKYHPGLDLEDLIGRIVESSPCFIENLQNGVLEQVTLSHLQNPRNWFSHEFVKSLHDLVEERIPDRRLGLKIGSTIFQAQPVFWAALGVSLFGLHRVARKVAKEAIRYDRTKMYSVQQHSKGIVGMRIIAVPGIVISEFTIQWHAGCFASWARLAGATNVSISLDCVDPGPILHGDQEKAVWDVILQYRDPGLPARLAKAFLFTLPRIRTRTEQAVIVEAENQEQIFTPMLANRLSRDKSFETSDISSDEREKLKDHLELTLSDLRALTFQVPPPVLYDFGLEVALEWLVTDINSRLDMHLLFVNLLDTPLNPTPQHKAILYRAIRELVANIIRHGETREGQIILSVDEDEIVVEVEDEGIGFAPEKITQGFGLFSLKERIRHLRGSLTIDSAPGEGTVVRLSVPREQMSQSASTG